MRKTLLLTLILLVFAAWAVAQQGNMPPTAPGPQTSPSSPSAPGSPSGPSTSDQSAQPSASDQAAQPSASETSIEGCLGGSAPNFTVVDKAGTTYQLQLPPNADASKLKDHVGQEVRVTGTTASAAAPSSPGSSASTPPAAGSTPAGGAAGQTINVSKMSKVADTCTSSPSGANPKQK